MSAVAHDGLARAIRPAHSMFDGDTVFGLATGAAPLPGGEVSFGAPTSRPGALNVLLTAAADTFAAACTHALLAARSHGDVPGYFDVCTSIDPAHLVEGRPRG
jgi:L-aminopeptidase/D-esterase-like protein